MSNPRPFSKVQRGCTDKTYVTMNEEGRVVGSGSLVDILGEDRQLPPDLECTFVVIDPPPPLITHLEVDVEGENVVQDQQRVGRG